MEDSNYFVVFTDHYAQYCRPYTIKQKTNVFDVEKVKEKTVAEYWNRKWNSKI